MVKCNITNVKTVILIACLFITGCVERKLTINTEPQGALVILNYEEIGTSPVTVSFSWYGDYRVRISKQGYETLNTHRDPTTFCEDDGGTSVHVESFKSA